MPEAKVPRSFTPDVDKVDRLLDQKGWEFADFIREVDGQLSDNTLRKFMRGDPKSQATFEVIAGILGVGADELKVKPVERSRGGGGRGDLKRASREGTTGELFPVRNASVVPHNDVIVCVIDIHRFSEVSRLIDAQPGGKVDDILATFFAAVNEAFRYAESAVQSGSQWHAEIAGALRPSMVKTLGDGVMVVWEFPREIMPPDSEVGLVTLVLDFVRAVQDHFYRAWDDVIVARYDKETLDKVNIRFGMSRGKAWRISGMGAEVDYVGPPVNEAFRLQDQAEPHGVIAAMTLQPHLFMERCCAKDGRICRVKLDAGRTATVWMSTARNTIHRRVPRDCGTIDGVMKIVTPRDDSRPQPKPESAPLSRDDVKSVFQVRQEWEANFAAELATRVRLGEIDAKHLQRIEATIVEAEKILKDSYKDDVTPPPGFQRCGNEFHGLIAEFSHEKEGQDRRKLNTAVYEYTRGMYSAFSMVLAKTLEEHRSIYQAIKDGDSEEARDLMSRHLKVHYALAKDAVMQNANLVEPAVSIQPDRPPLEGTRRRESRTSKERG